VLQLESPVDEGMRFVLVPASGRGPQTDEDDSDVCYAGVWALGRAGVFEGDWVSLRAVEEGAPGRTRIARVVAWERLDEETSDL
jgi:peroxin-6